jgi:hypothetical protein
MSRNERKSKAHFRRAAEYGFGVDARLLLPTRFFEAAGDVATRVAWRELMRRVLLPYEGQVPPAWVRDMRVALDDPVFSTPRSVLAREFAEMYADDAPPRLVVEGPQRVPQMQGSGTRDDPVRFD